VLAGRETSPAYLLPVRATVADPVPDTHFTANGQRLAVIYDTIRYDTIEEFNVDIELNLLNVLNSYI